MSTSDAFVPPKPKLFVMAALGAAGAIESAFCALAIRDQVMPPTLNLDNPSFETVIDLIPHKAKKGRVRAAMSNSFGFGGTNASLVLREVK